MARETKEWYRIAGLLARQRVGQITGDELRELETWKEASPENQILCDRWHSGDFLEEQYGEYKRIDYRGAMQEMEKRIAFQRRRELKSRVLRWSGVAAVVIVAVVSSLYLFETTNEQVVPVQEQIALVKAQRPMLKLDNGKTMLLDSLEGDFEEAGVLVKKAGGSTLTYLAEKPVASEVKLAYNTIEVPRGAEFDLVLADGTRVWLNADSKLKYPVTFGKDKREVELEGEGYFEVMKDKKRPFRVVVKGQTVEVLGTEFNVDAYPGEENVYTTLVNGKVKVDAGGKTVMLDPGMQSVVNDKGVHTRNVKAEDIVSWRDGMFVLEDKTLDEIMLKLTRWYNFEVFYQNQEVRSIAFKGKIPRYSSFESILNILEKTQEVQFKITGQTVVVYQ